MKSGSRSSRSARGTDRSRSAAAEASLPAAPVRRATSDPSPLRVARSVPVLTVRSAIPVSSPARWRAKRPRRLSGRYVRLVIARYTRPELGRIWTDEARMDAWRRVEVAACEAMEGPSGADLDAIRAATFTVEAVNDREKVTDHDMAAFVDVLSASAGD